MFPLSESEIENFSGAFPTQYPCVGWAAAILENLLEELTSVGFLRPYSQGLWQLFPKVGMTIQNILEVSFDRFVCLVLQSGDIDKITM